MHQRGSVTRTESSWTKQTRRRFPSQEEGENEERPRHVILHESQVDSNCSHPRLDSCKGSSKFTSSFEVQTDPIKTDVEIGKTHTSCKRMLTEAGITSERKQNDRSNRIWAISSKIRTTAGDRRKRGRGFLSAVCDYRVIKTCNAKYLRLCVGSPGCHVLSDWRQAHKAVYITACGWLCANMCHCLESIVKLITFCLIAQVKPTNSPGAGECLNSVFVFLWFHVIYSWNDSLINLGLQRTLAFIKRLICRPFSRLIVWSIKSQEIVKKKMPVTFLRVLVGVIRCHVLSRFVEGYSI